MPTLEDTSRRPTNRVVAFALDDGEVTPLMSNEEGDTVDGQGLDHYSHINHLK
jgi:hypothetical protein